VSTTNATVRPKQIIHLNIGSKLISREEALQEARRMEARGRVLANLSEARVIKKPGLYWINAESVPITQEAGQYMSIPAVPGYYQDNRDGTFTQINNADVLAGRISKDRSDVFVVPRGVAMATNKEDPLMLRIADKFNSEYYGRLWVVEIYTGSDRALIVSVPKKARHLRGNNVVVEHSLLSATREAIRGMSDRVRAHVSRRE
jgi:hypothetical protein